MAPQSDNRYNPTLRAFPVPQDAHYALDGHQFTRTPSGSWYSVLRGGTRLKIAKADAAKLEALRPAAA